MSEGNDVVTGSLASGETLAMTFVSGFFGFRDWPAVGVLLYVTRRGRLWRTRTVSLPLRGGQYFPSFLYHPAGVDDSFTRIIVGTSIGFAGRDCAMTVGAAPFIARMVENALLDSLPG